MGAREMLLTRRSLAILTGSLAFAVVYWYIKRQRSLQCLKSLDRSRKMVENSASQKSSSVSKVKINSKNDDDVIADVMVSKLLDDRTNPKLVNCQSDVKFTDGLVVVKSGDDKLSVKLNGELAHVKPSNGEPALRPCFGKSKTRLDSNKPDEEPNNLSTVKPGDGERNALPSDDQLSSGVSSTKLSSDLPNVDMIENVTVVKEISKKDRLLQFNEDRARSLSFTDKYQIDVEEAAESLECWKDVKDCIKKICEERKGENSRTASNAGEHISEPNTMGYRPINTPSSEGSQDSGRATGGLASSLSPADDVLPAESLEMLPIYEFEIPNSLVGLIIGIKGKTIKELCQRTDVKMVIRPHHTSMKMETHQICAVEGPRENINRCLRMMRRRFPAARFPELNLKPILPPPFPDPPPALYGVQPIQLTLPEGERCQVICSAIVNVGHFFLQQPQHPSFSALQRLDYYMLGVYVQPSGVPDIPKPVEADKLCVAPALGGWYRTVTLDYYPKEDEVLVKYVDYGGYSRLPRTDLRQIRTDFMTLPFQATECYLAHVEPVDGTTKWSDEAMELFETLVRECALECYVVGYHVDDLRPVVELFTTDENNRVDRVDSALLDAGLAKASDPSRVRPVHPRPVPALNASFNHCTGNEICAS